MKRILSTSIAVLALLATPLARAWTYSDRDALLIFRQSGFNDVEFDLGNVSLFTSLAAGTTITVPNWNLNLVTSTFGPDLTGVSVIVAATTGKSDPNRAAWLTGSDTNGTASDVLPSAWQSGSWSVIDAIGTKPVVNTVTATLTNAYSIDPSGVARNASYDYIVSGGGINSGSIAQFGGHAAFSVEGVAPTSFAFWQISPSLASPEPAATYVGAFTIDASGTLTFTAGPIVVTPTPPTILSITRSGGASTVTFTTATGGNYYLAYTNLLSGPVSSWPIVSGPITGDGNNQSLNHTSPDAGGFYGVVRAP